MLSQIVIPVDSVSLHQIGEIQRPVNFVYKIFGQRQFRHEKTKELPVDPLFHFQFDGVPPLALLELFLNFLEKIFGLVLGDLQIGASQDPVGA